MCSYVDGLTCGIESGLDPGGVRGNCGQRVEKEEIAR